MKKNLVAALALGIGAAGAVHAAPNDDVVARLNALEDRKSVV